MECLKRIGVIIFVGAVLFFLSQSFSSTDIAERSIALGIGIDKQGEQYTVTVEMVDASMQSEQASGVKASVFQSSGETIPKAIYNLYLETGKEVSLGQTMLVALGKSAYENSDTKQLLTYFLFSDAFKDGVLLVCCEDTASEMFQKKPADSSSVSFSIASLFSEDGKQLHPINDITTFAKEQNAVGKCSFLNIVGLKVQPETINEDSPKPFLYNTDKIAVFKENRYLLELDETSAKGFKVATEKATGDCFVVPSFGNDPDILPSIITVEVVKKEVKLNCSQTDGISHCEISVELSVRRSQTDSFATGIFMYPKEKGVLLPEMLDSIKTQAEEQVTQLLNAQQSENFDIMKITNAFYAKYGQQWLDSETDIANIYATAKITVKEI